MSGTGKFLYWERTDKQLLCGTRYSYLKSGPLDLGRVSEPTLGWEKNTSKNTIPSCKDKARGLWIRMRRKGNDDLHAWCSKGLEKIKKRKLQRRPFAGKRGGISLGDKSTRGSPGIIRSGHNGGEVLCNIQTIKCLQQHNQTEVNWIWP